MQSKQFRDKRSGEIVTQFNISEIANYEPVEVIKEVKATDFARSMGIEVVEM